MITLNNVTKTMDQKLILDHINFKFENKKNYIIKGESGVGKTTLLNIIFGYLAPDIGTVDITPSCKIEYLFQESLLFSNLTLKENLEIKYWGIKNTLVKNDFKYYIEEMLLLFSLHDLENKKISMLSGGERRRLELLQCLMSEPDILLLDEPTANLDYNNKCNIMKILYNNFNQTLKIIVSHDEEILEEYEILELCKDGFKRGN